MKLTAEQMDEAIRRYYENNDPGSYIAQSSGADANFVRVDLSRRERYSGFFGFPNAANQLRALLEAQDYAQLEIDYQVMLNAWGSAFDAWDARQPLDCDMDNPSDPEPAKADYIRAYMVGRYSTAPTPHWATIPPSQALTMNAL